MLGRPAWTIKWFLRGSVLLSAALAGGLLNVPLPLVTSAQGSSIRADALVLVNPASASYPDFQHYIQPYLDNFGIPYDEIDIATSPVGSGVGDYSLLIIGHRQIDPYNTYLDSTEEANISAAVSAGTGLVNFDDDLSGDGINPRYEFVDDIFHFGYGAVSTGSGVTFPSPQTHYVTERHGPTESIGTLTMSLAGITLPGGVTALAVTNTEPFVAVTTHGQGHAVQWGSYDWMSHSIKGPVYGLDDLVWRSIVWAARKPFVMQGLPPFVTMRVDDVSDPFEWIDTVNEFGIKPWTGLFLHEIDDTEAAELSSLVNAGLATASVHAFTYDDFFYFDPSTGADWPDNIMADYYLEATQWHITYSIPVAKIVVPHYYELGTNAFSGLSNWGVEFVATEIEPGQILPGSPWIMNGPYRLYEAGLAGPEWISGASRPLYYADFITVPNHPEFNGQFFNCLTEIRDDGGYEWYPSNDVSGTIGRGTRQTKRALDSMVLATLFTHGYYIHGGYGGGPYYDPISADNWRAILQGITSNLEPYDPIYVTLDDACQYVRAMYTSDVTDAVYDQASGQLTIDLEGYTDLQTMLYLFIEEDDQIQDLLVDVPSFSGSTQVVHQLGPPAPGTITIVKETDPSGGTDFSFAGSLGTFSLDDGESNEFRDLARGDYDVTEALPAGWGLDSVVCTGGDSDPVTGGVTIHLDAGEDIVCSFNNEELPPGHGSITVVKQTDPADGSGFSFAGDLGTFSLDDGGNKEFGDLAPGDYDVTEAVSEGWRLDSVVCTGGDSDPITGGVTIHLRAGEDVTCAFTNHSHLFYFPLVARSW
jgi:hypothetical protein